MKKESTEEKKSESTFHKENVHLGSQSGKEKNDVMASVELDMDDLKIDHTNDSSPDKQAPLGSEAEPENFIEKQTIDGEEKHAEVASDRTENLEMEASRSSSTTPPDVDEAGGTYAWPEKAVALKNFVKEKGAVAVSSVFRRLSGKMEEDEQVFYDAEEKNDSPDKVSTGDESQQVQRGSDDSGEQSKWNPLNFIKIVWDADMLNMADQLKESYMEYSREEARNKGRIVVYTRLGCHTSKELRLFLHQKGLKYIEINLDIYPNRKLELEKNTGSSDVPRVYFNDLLIGSLPELKALNESGKLGEKIDYVVKEEPSPAAPLPPLPGEDDVSGNGIVDELSTIVRKMKETIVLKDRFYKMRRFSNCFLGSEAVDFLAEDQYLEREEAVEFGRKLAEKLFFQHVLEENIFEDGNHLYRFLEHDPVVVTQCYNIPRGILEAEPKPITEIASRLRLLSYAIFEAYVSEDGLHVDYRSIHESEEFRRYLRIIEELHRVELEEMTREEKISFFINLYNMMVVHAILTWGYPVGALDRRKFFLDFKYVVGGCAYSLSTIQNGVLRGNQRPPFNLSKPYGSKDRRSKVALPYAEPLIHFALATGARSGPALRCYSPGNIDKELMDAARYFLRNGGIFVDPETKVVSASKILKWYNVDFGNNEVEVMKHAANYLEPSKSEEFLELLASSQVKVTYQTYDWGLNY